MPAIHLRLGAFSAALAILAVSYSGAYAQKAYDPGATELRPLKGVRGSSMAYSPDT